MSSCLTAHQHNTGYSVPLKVECWNMFVLDNEGSSKSVKSTVSVMISFTVDRIVILFADKLIAIKWK